MNENLPAELRAIELGIKEAFRGVTWGGVSWSEAEVLYWYGSDDECKAARLRDLDRMWQELVEDSNWVSDSGIGGWSFLDADGFRYYLPAAMTRRLRSGFDEGIVFHLTLPDSGELRDYTLEQWSLLNMSDQICVRRFLQLHGRS